MSEANKTKAVKITVTRFEGRSAECDVPHSFEGEGVWTRATALLRKWGNSGPKDMLGAFKCGFEIVFADGETYEGRFDAKPGCETLAEHVRTHCEFHSGRAVNPWMGEVRYRAFLSDVVSPENQAAYGKVLDGYEIGDSTSVQAAWLDEMGAL